MYREQGALAAEGTALKIGDITSTADVWKEYAQPPYFVPYHGAISQGVHILSIAPGATAWTDSQPSALAEGSAWQLTASTGLALAAHADSVKNGAAVVSLADIGRGSVFTLEGQSSSSGWAISRVRFGPSGAKPEHTLSLVFSPPLGQSGDSHFDILAGKKSKLAAGTRHRRAYHRHLEPRQPQLGQRQNRRGRQHADAINRHPKTAWPVVTSGRSPALRAKARGRGRWTSAQAAFAPTRPKRASAPTLCSRCSP